eukprot:816625-Lingulodinium_polyedra.AAC.1
MRAATILAGTASGGCGNRLRTRRARHAEVQAHRHTRTLDANEAAICAHAALQQGKCPKIYHTVGCDP